MVTDTIGVPQIRLLHPTGIKTGQGVCKIIAAGSGGSGSSGAIALAEDPCRVFRKMVEAVRRAWDERRKT